MRVENQIRETLSQSLSPVHLDVINESHQHNVAEGSESHFRVVIVSSQFEGLTLIKRHRAVNEALAALLKESIHALALQTYSPKEWDNQNVDSPPCLGGSKNEG